MNKSYESTVAETRFTGLFIHSEILHLKEISAFEKILLGWIDSYYQEGYGGCFASNEHLAQVTEDSRPNRIAKSISKLRKLGLIVDVSFNGRIRVIRSTIGQTIEKIRKQNERQSFPHGKQQDSHTGKANDPSHYTTIGKYENIEASPLAFLLLEKLIERVPNRKKPDLKKWAKEIDDLMRLDERKPEEVKKVIEYIFSEKPWFVENIQCPKSLRRNYDRTMDKMLNSTESSDSKNDIFHENASNAHGFFRSLMNGKRFIGDRRLDLEAAGIMRAISGERELIRFDSTTFEKEVRHTIKKWEPYTEYFNKTSQKWELNR